VVPVTHRLGEKTKKKKKKEKKKRECINVVRGRTVVFFCYSLAMSGFISCSQYCGCGGGMPFFSVSLAVLRRDGKGSVEPILFDVFTSKKKKKKVETTHWPNVARSGPVR
jgi:hypothetical protein